MNRVQNICVVDPSGGTGEDCGCGEEAMFIVGIGESVNHLCDGCIAELAKRIIDGLR